MSYLERAIDLIQTAPCGDSWIEVLGKTYHTDVGYAMEGIEILLDIAKKLEEGERKL